MAAESLNPGHKYTFAYIDNNASIVASSDNVTKTYFRDDIQVTGSMEIGGVNQPLYLDNDDDIRIRFNATEFGPVSSQRWVMGVDSEESSGGPVNTFCINQGTSFTSNVDFRVSGSTIVLDVGSMPTSPSGLQSGTVYKDASNFLKIVP